jgi:alpha-tubulin suppressor-like RCC1 family protein
VSIAVGGSHTCALTQQGRAYCWGYGGQGRLGNDSNENSLVPAPVAGGVTFATLAAGWHNTCGLTRDGELFCWGGMHGTGLPRIGGMEPDIAFVPERVPGSLRFTQVTSGEAHVCAVAKTGQAYCWGGNEEGELGSGRTSERELKPVAVAGNHSFVSLSAGYSGDTCGITSAGAAFCWGPNDFGAHGNGTGKSSSVPVPVSGNHRFASISVGMAHACGVTVDAEIYCWGAVDSPRGGGPGLGLGSKVPTRLRDTP